MTHDTGDAGASPDDRIAHDYHFDERDHADLAGASRDPHPLTAERYLA